MQVAIRERYATFDIESREWIHFEVMGFYDGEDYYKFTSIAAFLTFLNRTKRYSGWRLFAHNGGRFDFLFFLEPMISSGWILRLIPRGSTVIVIEATSPSGNNFVFSDSYVLMPLSLRDLSASFHVKTTKGEIDYSRISKTDAKTLRYLERDCISLYECLEVFFSSPYVVDPQLTIASQALDTFRKKFSRVKLVPMDIREEAQFRWQYYSGGRVEVFKGYGRDLEEYDVNSLYPYAMLGEMPCGVPDKVGTYQEGKLGFYNVRVKATPNFWIPPFLTKIRTKAERKNYYVNGPGDFFVSSLWIDHLQKTYGMRFEILGGWAFPDRRPLFEDWVRTLYEVKLRKAGTPEYQIVKLLLNSLYGKLGAKRERSAIVSYNDTLGDGWREFSPENGLVAVDQVSKSRWILPYLAAFITDKARLHHWSLMQKHEHEIYYCDTDSIITTASYPISSEIGSLGSRDKYNEGVFLNSKCYALRKGRTDKVKFKGFDTEQFTFASMLDHLRTREPLVETRKRILSFSEITQQRNGREVVRKKGIVDRAGKFLVRIEQEKRAEIGYSKRLTIPSRKHIFDTKPYSQEELQDRLNLADSSLDTKQLSIHFQER